jgi:EAL domain-containing protein (putative c-di-GMP-specific phosphodiesterase class I)
MKTCSQCEGNSPPKETGQLIFSSFDYRIFQAIAEEFQPDNAELGGAKTQVHLTYDSWDMLRALFYKLEKKFSRRELEKISGRIITSFTPEMQLTANFPISQLREQVKHPECVKIIQEQLFQSHLQPIISTGNAEVYGYEFWLKPKSKLYPFETKQLLEFAKKSGLDVLLDSQARYTAVRTSAYKLERGVKRFINFLPSTISAPQDSLHSTFQAARDYDVAMDDIVLHVSRMEKLRDVKHLYYIFNECRKAGVKTALNATSESVNFSSPHLQRLRPDIISVGRSLTEDCHLDEEKIERIRLLKAAAEQIDSLLLANGIHSKEEYEAVRPYTDLVQGEYIGKPHPMPSG